MATIQLPDGYTLEDIVKDAVQNALAAIQQPKPLETLPELPETHVPKGSVNRYKNIEDYPPIMFVDDVKDFTRLGTNKVYELINHSKCPTIRYGGKLCVYRDELHGGVMVRALCRCRKIFVAKFIWSLKVIFRVKFARMLR